MLGRDDGRQLREDELGDGQQVALTLEHPGELGEVGLQPVLLGVLLGRVLEVTDHLIDIVLQRRHLALGLQGDRAGEVALGDRGGHFGDGADLRGQVGGELVDVLRQVLPGPGGARHLGLSAELALDAHLAGHGGDLLSEGGQGIGHLIDRVGEGRDLPLGLDDQLPLQVAVGDGGDDLGDPPHLACQVAGHAVDVVGQVLPDPRHAADLGLAAELTLGADLARHAGDFGGERVELVDHRVDGVLELEDLALDIDGDLLGQVAIGNRGRHLGDVADLVRQVAGHAIDVVGQVLPDPRHAADLGLAAESSLGADLACHAGHLAGERVELVDHRVDRVLQLQDLSPDVDGDFLGQVAVGDGGRHLGDVADLAGEVAGHRVDAVGQVLPDARHALELRLPAETSLGADLARDAGDFAGERVELIDHRVDRVLQLRDLALDVRRLPSCGGRRWRPRW